MKNNKDKKIEIALPRRKEFNGILKFLLLLILQALQVRLL
jgi:hypothetical protein